MASLETDVAAPPPELVMQAIKQHITFADMNSVLFTLDACSFCLSVCLSVRKSVLEYCWIVNELCRGWREQ